jgi:hypothetical protein
MLHLPTLLILLIAFSLEIYLFKRLQGQSISLAASLLLIINVALLVLLIGYFHSITDIGTTTDFTAMNSLISFNTLSTKIRNSIVIIGLVFISYGLYDQSGLSRNKLFLYLSYITAGITLGLLIMMIMAGGFII